LLGIAAGGRLSELVKAFPVYFGSKDYRVECPDERKFQVVEELKARLRKEHQVVDIDGVRVNFPKGWFIIRASNTGPQLAVRWEASEKEEFGRIKALVQAQLESVGLKLE
ncbi:MAG: phosphomannomutase, partial [Candidatus Aenigmatarchaeota archaeon]